MMIQRALSLLAAVFLVLAVGLATYGARAMSLEFALRRVDRSLLDSLYLWVNRSFGQLAWTEVVQPVLVRPAWMPCAALGLLFLTLGIILSYRTHPGKPRGRG